MKTHSLARQTLLIVLTAQVFCALALSGFTLLRESRAHLRAFDVRLQGRSDSLLGTIQDAEDANSSVRIDPAELKVPANDVFAVYNQGGALLGSSAEAPSALIARGHDGYRTVRVQGIRYRVLQREALRVIDRAEFHGVGLMRPVTILYASPETHVLHEIFEAASYLLLAIFLVAAFTILFLGIFLRRALRPLDELALAASRVSVPSLRFEPPLSVLQVRELRPLAEVLTEFIARLRDSFQKEQRFVGDAAHELKTAVAVVRSSLQVLMLKRRSQEEYVTGLNRVLEDNVRVESLVTKMLELANISEAHRPNATVLDLSEVATAVAENLRPFAEEKGISIRTTCSSDAMVLLSREHAQTLMSNLLVNAIQHSVTGMVVDLSVQRTEADKIVVKVADTGTGISEAALPHIFDRFYREDLSRSRETGGAGLGLSICKSIVDSTGGTIRAESQRNAGTTMTIVLSSA